MRTLNHFILATLGTAIVLTGYLALLIHPPFPYEGPSPPWPYNPGYDTESVVSCPLPEIPFHASDGLQPSRLLLTPEAVEVQVKRLSAAVNINTASYDDNDDVDYDPRWAVFEEFHVGLEKQFPLVHEKGYRDKVNKYGLVFTFPGRSSRKPILFMAHQDVVPFASPLMVHQDVVPSDSPLEWRFDHSHAYYDGAYLWGRGSAEGKNNLIGLLSTMESLLDQGFEPNRTIVFAFGFDERTGGKQGGRHIAAHLLNKYGNDSFAMIMDAGGVGLTERDNVAYARPAVTEKGFLDIRIALDLNGGDSSKPPERSGIGIMSEMVLALENNNVFQFRFNADNPLRKIVECEMRYSRRQVNPLVKHAFFAHRSYSNLGRIVAESRGDEARYAIQTSQAVTVIEGGEKNTRLVEGVHTLVNYRIAPHDTIGDIKRRVLVFLLPIAHEYGLGVQGFGYNESRTENGALILSSKNDLKPSPISPTGANDAVWRLFAGTIRQVFEDVDALKGKTVVPVGDIMHGNTDTIHYWDLSPNIYRFTPARSGTRLDMHTTNERVLMDAHMEGMRVYYDLIRNFDGWEDV